MNGLSVAARGMRLRTMLGAGVAAAGLCCAMPLYAQTAQPGGAGQVSVYDGTFFEAFAPTNALQMIERLPGFILDGGATGVRGFGQAAGNVVINGQRPSTKSDSLSTVLSRIPASRVVRVEMSPGSHFGADYAGKPQVANVILSDDGGLSGAFEGKLVREFSGSILPHGSGSVVFSRGHHAFTAAFEFRNWANDEEGFDTLYTLPSRDLVEHRDIYRYSREPYKIGSLGWAFEEAPNKSAHLNAKVSIDPWDVDQTSHATIAAGGTRDDFYFQRHVWKTYELSGDITRPLAGGAIKLNALGTNRDRKHDDWSEQYITGEHQGGSAQQLDDKLEERVARLTWSKSKPGGWQFEVGAEGAFNRLTSDIAFFAIDADNDRTRVDLPIDDAVVTEKRGEAFVNLGRDLGSGLYLDVGVTFETSNLEVTGDVEAERSLQFWKPKASLEWNKNGWHTQLSVARTVSQLDFGDFVSGAELTDDRVSGGNADLEPQTAWEFLFSADRSILGDGRIKLDLGYDLIQDVQDRIPITGGLDAPGNLGSGRQFTARGTMDLPLSPLGIRGGRLNMTGTYIDTSVTDPYTLEDRRFSGGIFGGIPIFAYSVSVRQDLASWAWGVEAKGNTGMTGYWRTEEDKIRATNPNVHVFAEYRPMEGMTARLGVENALDRPTKRWREMYTPDRTSLAPSFLEYRERTSHSLVYLSVKQNFK